jgi:hypothetical protein
MAKRRIERSGMRSTAVLKKWGEIEMGVGTLQKTNQRAAEAVKPAVEVLWEWAPQQANVHVDETPWSVMGVKEWLWTASGEGFCLFHAADTRGRVELETRLGTEFAGVLSSDDFSVYNGCSVQAQQKCLAHLLRHFKKVLGLPGHNHNATVAQVFIDLINEAFQQHHLWRQHLDLHRYHQWAAQFTTRLNQALNTWLGRVGHAAGLLLKSLRDKAAQLAQNQELTAWLGHIEEQVAQNSQNSSKPPSKDGFGAKPKPKKVKGQRARGGQSGHPGHERNFHELTTNSEIYEHIPDSCRVCGVELEGADPQPLGLRSVTVPYNT